MEAAAYRDASDASMAQVCYSGAARYKQDVDGAVDGRDERCYLGEVDHARGIEDIGAGLLEGLEALDRIAQVGMAPQVVFGPGGQDQAGAVAVETAPVVVEPVVRGPVVAGRVVGGFRRGWPGPGPPPGLPGSA